MSHNQETEVLAPHAADGLIHNAHGATANMGSSSKAVPGEMSKRKSKKKAGEHMKYHKPTSKRRALQVRHDPEAAYQIAGTAVSYPVHSVVRVMYEVFVCSKTGGKHYGRYQDAC